MNSQAEHVTVEQAKAVLEITKGLDDLAELPMRFPRYAGDDLFLIFSDGAVKVSADGNWEEVKEDGEENR